MKQKWIILSSLLLFMQTANALIVSVEGKGDIPAEGMEITLNEAEEDPLTGEDKMEVQGTLLCQSPLHVTIIRSATGLRDEFCCAGQCTTGNGQGEETLDFVPEGVTTWFAHYTPAAGTNETVVYTFSDDQESRTLTVHYNYGSQAVETVSAQQQATAFYSLTGNRVGTNLSELPEGVYINNGNKIIKIQH